MKYVYDTLRKVAIITIRQNEAGDTIRMNTVTDRDYIRSMADARSKREMVQIE